MSLDAIFFDVDDTLFSTSEFARKARRAACEAMHRVGLRLDVEVLEDELQEVVAEFSSNYDHHFDQLLRRIPRRHYKGVNPAIIVAAAVKAYHDTKATELAPFPDALALLRDLSRLDIVRGIITSGLTVKQAEKLLRLGVYELLTPSAIYISEQIGINKPNVKLWRRACSDLNLKPSCCMYVGDRMQRDIDPAKTLGMIAVHLRRGGKYAAEDGRSDPDHRIASFEELRGILCEAYGLELPRTAAP
ncbi:MAG: TIGR02253 family HAD-type hydrolase, partial [Planctomycetota bacterium]